MCEDERRQLGLLDNVRDRKCLTAAGNAEQHLIFNTVVQILDELCDGLGLIALRNVVGDETKLHNVIYRIRQCMVKYTSANVFLLYSTLSIHLQIDLNRHFKEDA
jgi:hypothetical protein